MLIVPEAVFPYYWAPLWKNLALCKKLINLRPKSQFSSFYSFCELSGQTDMASSLD